jgi:hypothetical protein
MVSAVTIEVTFPEAGNAEVILTIIAMEGSSTVLTLFTLLLRLDDLSIRHVNKQRFVFESLALMVHGLEALETKVVFTTCTENLRFFHCTG